MKDLYGKAIYEYYNGERGHELRTYSSVSGWDVLPLPYLFRSFEEMPEIEQQALKMARGKVLDVGCGAGSHSIYLQQKGLDVTAIDVSEGAVQICKQRGIKDVRNIDVLKLKEEKFDTILLLMNGAGMCGKLKNLSRFLSHLKTLLHPGGQILADSSDIIYMFEKEDYYLEKSPEYYGEVNFTVAYKEETDTTFDWLYVDFNNLKEQAQAAGLRCERLVDGEHYDYLARLL